MYRVLFGARALRDLKKLDKSSKERIVGKIEKLASGLTGDIKKLTDHSPQYRLRVGYFRVLFDIDGSTIIIQTVRNRRDAY